MNQQRSVSIQNQEGVDVARERAGYVQIPNRVLFDRALTNTEFRILATILAHDWGDRGAGCRLSYQRIGELSSSSESAVKRAIKKLQASGYLYPPQPIVIAGRRYSTTLRATALAREHGPLRPEVVVGEAAPHQPMLDDGAKLDPSSLDPLQSVQVEPTQRVHETHGDGSSLSSTTNTVKDRIKITNNNPVGKKGFKIKCFRAEVVREPLLEIDNPRLRTLDAWGCPDSQDWLGLMLGILAQRERQMDRVPDPMRIRAAYDGAAVSRMVKRADNPLGMLLAGIERGFLLATPKAVSPAQMVPGVREMLNLYVQRALEGKTVDAQALRDLGISAAQFDALVRDARPAETQTPSARAPSLPSANRSTGLQIGNGSNLAPSIGDPQISALYQAFVAELSESALRLWVDPTAFVKNAGGIEARCRTPFAADRLRTIAEKMKPRLSQLGITLQIVNLP